MRLHTLSFLLCLTLAGCGGTMSAEDMQMTDAMCAQGKQLLADGKITDARDIYLSAVQRDDENARAWNGLGVAYDMLGKTAEAMNALQHAANIAPDDMTIANNLAHVQMESGDPEAAVAILDPHANNSEAPKLLQQNLAAAQKAAQRKKEIEGGAYADLGSYPTHAMAENHIDEARELLENNGDVVFTILPEKKIGGGTIVFTVKATGRSPRELCKEFNAEAFPCIAHSTGED